jgi:hopene-associated glycosyltransferase HpnB
VIRSTPRPPGWSGKLWAVKAGLDHVEACGHTASLLLLTDADIAHHQGTLSSLIEKMVNEGRDLVSLMVCLRADSFWERLLIPPFVFFFQMLYPFPAVNDPRSGVAAAAGGYVLLRREALADAGGIEAISGALIDDVALGRLIKRRPNGEGRVWLGLARRTASLRAYDTLAPIWAMVARTADTQLGHSLLKLVGTVLGLVLLYLLPPLLVLGWPLHQDAWFGLLGLGTWGAMSLAYWPTLKLYQQPAWQVLTLPVAALLYAGMTIDSARLYRLGQGGLWKGRVFID